jgi:hypothetical protein
MIDPIKPAIKEQAIFSVKCKFPENHFNKNTFILSLNIFREFFVQT